MYRAGMQKRLNEREAKICKYVAQGISNRVIAHKLRLSEQTVKNYLGGIFRKLGVDNRVQLALLAARRGKRAAEITSAPKRAKAS
jgi:DNA-binding NarL/FixJ family response regulator